MTDEPRKPRKRLAARDMKHLPLEVPRADIVKQLAGYGMRTNDIAAILGLSHDTVENVYGAELAEGRAKANLRVAETLFEMATSGQNTAATIFWCKTRMGWREVSRHDIRVGVTDARALSSMTDDELEMVARGVAPLIEGQVIGNDESG